MDKELKRDEYVYNLPAERIASYPLAERDHSRLLMCKSKTISHHHFSDLPDLLSANSTLFFNDTRVIPARLLFHKETGAAIEVFLLHPSDKSLLVQLALQSSGNTIWKCTIGNLKRWKQGSIIVAQNKQIKLSAFLIDSLEGLVEFSWVPNQLTFAEVINELGNTPLPPYLNRKPIEQDKVRYQTVYSHFEGAVAAPTAGLHFTEKVISKLASRNIATEFLTLHVSAGTFQPIKTENALAHSMHAEQVVVSRQNLEALLRPDKKIIGVGTTSMRTLESLYWYGVKIINEGNKDFTIEQSYPYQHDQHILPPRNEAFEAVLGTMASAKTLFGQTSIFIVPGYQFRVCDGLITNFHQPGSTLMLLVAAFVGPSWKAIYKSALESDYRFLSYGDSSLLIP